jgi:hypothetical protein
LFAYSTLLELRTRSCQVPSRCRVNGEAIYRYNVLHKCHNKATQSSFHSEMIVTIYCARLQGAIRTRLDQYTYPLQTIARSHHANHTSVPPPKTQQIYSPYSWKQKIPPYFLTRLYSSISQSMITHSTLVHLRAWTQYAHKHHIRLHCLVAVQQQFKTEYMSSSKGCLLLAACLLSHLTHSACSQDADIT